MNQSFVCATCGEFHPELPLVLGPDAPLPWFELSEKARKSPDSVLGSDQCVIDGKRFFMLARLELPIVNGDLPFTWLCWTEMKKRDFLRASELWDVEGRESEPPYVVSVATALPYPQETLGLRGQMITRALGQRPFLVLDQIDHPLYSEQAYGISMERVQQIVERALHEA